MLKNAYLVAKIGADTAENEQHVAEILPIGRRVADRCGASAAQPGGRQLRPAGGTAASPAAAAARPGAPETARPLFTAGPSE